MSLHQRANQIATTSVKPHLLSKLEMEIVTCIQSPTITIQEVVALIGRDRGLTRRILRLVNTSHYAIPGGVSDVKKALQYIGEIGLMQMILTK